MSKKVVLFLLAFGFAASFGQASAGLNFTCQRDCRAFQQSCVAGGYGADYCAEQFQNCVAICLNQTPL